MSCTDYSVLISRLLDGEIPDAEREALGRHLSVCAGCRETLEAWRSQGAQLREVFARHALGPEFVQKVRLANRSAGLVSSPVAERGWLGKDLFAWLQAAAAVLVAVIVLFHFFRGSSDLGMAQVLSAGQSLEALSAKSYAWVPMPLGSELHPGDWLRNRGAQGAELLIRESMHLLLGEESLAQLRRGGSGQSEIFLAGGSLRARGSHGARPLRIQTASGEVSAAAAQFEARQDSISLARLTREADGSERWTGSVVPMTAVTVESGKVEIITPAARRQLSAGSSVLFTSRLFGAGGSSQDMAVSLQPVSSSGTGYMNAGLIVANDRLRISLDADGVPLDRLVGWTTKSTVRGGVDMRVKGHLEFPADAAPEVLAAGIGRDLGLEITLRVERQMDRIASLPDSALPALDSSSELAVTRSADDRISFRFTNAPAGEALRALRSLGIELPHLAAGSENAAVTLQADHLRPEEVPSLLEQRLAWSISRGATLSRFAEIRAASLEQPQGVPADVPGIRREPSRVGSRSNSTIRPAGSALSLPATPSRPGGAGMRLAQVASFHSHSFVPGISFPTSKIPGAAPPSATAARPSSARRGSDSVTLTARASARSADSGVGRVRPGRGRHLAWPAQGSPESGFLESYYLYNPWPSPARATWYGYDSLGRLVAAQEQEIAPYAGSVLNPTALGEGGHWESMSDLPLEGAGWRALPAADVLFAAQSFEDLEARGEYPARLFRGLGGRGRISLVNPGNAGVRAVIAVLSGDQLRVAQEIILAPHGGALWSLQGILPAFPELSLDDVVVVVQVMEGSLALGWIEEPREPAQTPSGSGREIVTLGDPIP